MPGETLKSCHRNMKQISFLRSKDPSHGEAPASLQDSRATTPALRLQGHLSPDVRLRARGTEPSQVLAQQPLQLQATPPTHLGKGARDASHGEGLLPPTWETGEGTAAAMAGGHQGRAAPHLSCLCTNNSVAQRESPVAQPGRVCGL